MPFGLALSADGRRLTRPLLRSMLSRSSTPPTAAWSGICRRVGVRRGSRSPPDGRTLYVVTARGYGAGPNGGKDFNTPAQGTYIGDIQLAACTSIDVSDEKLLAAQRSVSSRTRFRSDGHGRQSQSAAAGTWAAQSRSRPHHLRDEGNRTFDEVLANTRAVTAIRPWRGSVSGLGAGSQPNPCPRHQVTAKNRSRASTVPDAPTRLLRELNGHAHIRKIARQWALRIISTATPMPRCMAIVG